MKADLDALVDAYAVEMFLGARPATVRSWERRGQIAACGVDWRGRKLYRLEDLLACQETRRENAVVAVQVRAMQH